MALLVAALGTSAAAGGLSATPTRPGATKPRPATAQKAIALVRSHPDTNQAAAPFKREIRWAAEWRGDRWWVLGLFESDWGAQFVVDAAIRRGQVYTYGPSRVWVRARATRWGLRTLYTRFTPAAAIEAVKESNPYEETAGLALSEYTIVDAAARLATDTADTQAWYFAFYVQPPSGDRRVLAVTGLGGSGPANEGLYSSGYGFGATPQVFERIPLNLLDWVRAVAKARGWQPSNL